MEDRDRKLSTARRLGKGIIALGVAGSLGVAGLVGLSAAQHGSRTASPGTAPSGASGSGSSRRVHPRSDDGGFGSESDDGFTLGNQNAPAPPSLQQGGGGAPHGTTTGS